MRFFPALLVMLLAVPCWAAPPVRLVSEAHEQGYRAHFPVLDDSEWQAVLDAKDLILYTRNAVPPAYQDDNGTFISTKVNPSGRNRDRFGNPNREFPWAVAGGTQSTADLEIVRFVRFPTDADGAPVPMIWWYERILASYFNNNGARGIKWRYPDGTVFGELLAMSAPNGKTYAFELRLRKREGPEWLVQVFKPFPTATSLSKRIQAIRPDWAESPALSAQVAHLDAKLIFPTMTVKDANRDRVAFASTREAHLLPALNDTDLVAELLVTTRWSSALGVEWKGKVSAPTIDNAGGFHIVPASYKAHAFAVDSQSCMNCHQHTNHAARIFDEERDWYGRIRGSDGIFSFHPIEPSAISQGGGHRQVVMRAQLTQAGLVERYDEDKHSDQMYPALLLPVE